MSVKNKPDLKAEPEQSDLPIKRCFVIMPIADMDGYELGHFSRVYEHLIKPAIEDAGYQSHRADLVNSSNYIIIDILQKIVECDMVICDLSGRNPNVLYELGVRQAFNLPTVLIKDRKTPNIFDIQGLRYMEYSESLRIDEVQTGKLSILKALNETAENPKDVNSMIQLLGVKPAALPSRVELSNDTSIILESLKDVANRIAKLESSRKLPSTTKEYFLKDGNFVPRVTSVTKTEEIMLNGMPAAIGDKVFHGGKEVGKLVAITDENIAIMSPSGSIRKFLIDSEGFSKLEAIPF
jgi:hypothetical protein